MTDTKISALPELLAPSSGDVLPITHLGTTYKIQEQNLVPAQVNADWNAVSGVAQILNKPILAQTMANVLHKWLNSYNATTGLFTQTQPDYSDLTGVPSTFPPTAHATSHESGGSDTVALDTLAAPTDIATLNASTSAHGLLLKAVAPAANVLNVVGIANGETVYANKSIFDATNPVALGAAGPGTSLIAAHRDHIHPTTGLALSTTTISVSGLGLSGGGDLSANRTITLTSSNDPGAAASILATDISGITRVAGFATKGLLVSNNAAFTTIAQNNVEVDAADGSSSSYLVRTFGTANIYPLHSLRHYRGTGASSTATQLNDVLGVMDWGGFKATLPSAATASIQAVAVENWSDTATGTQLEFYTTPALSTTASERLRIQANGAVNAITSFTIASGTAYTSISNNPGAAAAILATPASGVPTLVGLKITPTASSDANTIDDYTEGTWTPTFFSTSASFTYTNQFGFYTKIGNVVHAIIYLTGTATGTVTNGLYVVLTHTQKNETGRTSVGLVGYTDCSVSPVLVGNTNSTLVNINQFGTTTQLTPTTAGMTGGTSKTFICSMTYFV